MLEPSESTFAVAKSVHAVPGERALVVGTGAGYIPLLLAQEGLVVTGIDVDPVCVAGTRELLSETGQFASIYQADFNGFTSEEPFGWIVSNPPQQPGDPSRYENQPDLWTHWGGFDGLDMICSLLSRGRGLLAPKGHIVMSIFDFLRDDRWMLESAALGYTYEQVLSIKHERGVFTSAGMAASPDAYAPHSLQSDTYTIRVFDFQIAPDDPSKHIDVKV